MQVRKKSILFFFGVSLTGLAHPDPTNGMCKVRPDGYSEHFAEWKTRDALGPLSALVDAFFAREIGRLRQALKEFSNESKKDVVIAQLRKELAAANEENMRLLAQLEEATSSKKRRGGNDGNKVRRVPPGMTNFKNLGNTCFFSTALQALAHCKPIVENREILANGGNQFCKDFGTMLNDMWGKMAPTQFWPTELLAHLAAVDPDMGDGLQHDAEEALTLMLDMLQEGCRPIVQGLWGQEETHTQCCLCGQARPVEVTPFLKLDVPLHGSKALAPSRHVTLEDCLDFYSEKRTMGLDEEWRCCPCNGSDAFTKAYRFSRFVHLPEVLIIRLKREYSRGRLPNITTHKHNTKINYPVRGLDMDRWVPGAGVYDLVGNIRHDGRTLHSGHYIIDCLMDGTDQWARFNDLNPKTRRLDKVSIERSTEHQAYILIYQRRQHQQQLQEGTAKNRKRDSDDDEDFKGSDEEVAPSQRVPRSAVVLDVDKEMPILQATGQTPAHANVSQHELAYKDTPKKQTIKEVPEIPKRKLTFGGVVVVPGVREATPHTEGGLEEKNDDDEDEEGDGFPKRLKTVSNPDGDMLEDGTIIKAKK